MSIKSQTNNMRRLAALLNFNLCNIHGKKKCGPNGSKQVFLNVGKVFLRALARDLGLHDVTVSSNAGGIGVSECGRTAAFMSPFPSLPAAAVKCCSTARCAIAETIKAAITTLSPGTNLKNGLMPIS